jgi:hypothetical protein
MVREDGDIRIACFGDALTGLGEGYLIIGSCGATYSVLRQIVLLHLMLLSDRPAVNLMLARTTTGGGFHGYAEDRIDLSSRFPYPA